MNSENQIFTLDELCEKVIDCPHSTPVWMNSGVVVLRSSNIKGGRLDLSNPSYTDEHHYEERSRRARVQAGDLVITREAPMGEVCLIPENLKCCLGQRMVMLRPNPNVCHGKYLLYALQSTEVQSEIKSHDGTGSTVSNLRIPVLKSLPIPTPDLGSQKVIANILGTLDEKIDLNSKGNATLEAMAMALFKSWFVDFDPVRAKLEDRATALPAEITDLFPDSFEDSELGEIPSGWKVGALEQILEIDPPRKLTRGSISPYLEMKGVPTHCHRAVGVINREFSSGSKFRNGDTLLARITPCLENGKTAFVDFLEDEEIGWGSTEFIVMCGRREEVNHFAYYLARSEVFRNHAIQNMDGSSGRQRVPSSVVKGFTLPLPPEEILVRFGLIASCLMNKIAANAEQSRILLNIRDAILPKLISGEIRIPDAERMLEEVGV
jgi:type I restriction enzyme S subunit